MAADIVNAMMYIQHGKPFPKKLKMKGIASSKTLIGYSGYTAGSNRRGVEEGKLEFNGGYLQYTSREESRQTNEVKTFSNKGWIKNKDEYENFRSEIGKAFSKDDEIAWIPIQSFKDYFTAEQYGLFKEEDYARVFSAVLPKFFRSVGLSPDNMIWWMDYHTNKAHPHTHIVFLEKEKTRDNPLFSLKAITDFKADIFKEAYFNQRAIENNKLENLQSFKEKDMAYKEIHNKAIKKIKERTDLKINLMIENLFSKIDTSTEITGRRLQYNSSHMIAVRSDINDIIDYVLKNDPECKSLYDEFTNKCEGFDQKVTNKITSKYSGMLDSENKKLYAAIGNAILRLKKDADNFRIDNVVRTTDFSEPVESDGAEDSRDIGKKEAIFRYQEAEEKGNIHAAYRITELLSKEETLTDEQEEMKVKYTNKAFKKYQDLSDADTNGMINFRLAKMIHNGWISQPAENAIKYYEKASDLGASNSRYFLAQLLIENNRVAEGINILRSEAQNGNAQAMVKLGLYYIKGEVVPKDRYVGLEHMKAAADNGNEFAKSFLANSKGRSARTGRSTRLNNQQPNYSGNTLAATASAIRKASKMLDYEKQKMEDEFYRPNKEGRMEPNYEF